VSRGFDRLPVEHSDLAYLYALQVLPESERVAAQAHIATCEECRCELTKLRPVVESFAAWPTNVLRPAAPLWDRLAQRIAAEGGSCPSAAPTSSWREPEWKEVAPGIHCKLLANDPQTHMVSMLVRLEPGVEYPPHTHAGIEELHLLEGELWIDDRKLFPGDYNRGEPGTGDKRVWSETGCTCVLITSTRDVLG
jgi:anti-sigma factor ChrR (cupin superfamily)